LALAQVAAYVIASDCAGPSLGEEFTDRLLACLEPSSRRRFGWRRLAYIGGPLAAAAAVVFAFLGVFDRPKFVAGWVDIGETKPASIANDVSAADLENTICADKPALEDDWNRIVEQLEQSLNTKFDSGRFLINAFDRQMEQVMDLLETALSNTLEPDQPGDCDDQSGSQDASPPGGPEVEVEDL